MLIAIDTETYLIKGRNVPPFVCLSYAELVGADGQFDAIILFDAVGVLDHHRHAVVGAEPIGVAEHEVPIEGVERAGRVARALARVVSAALAVVAHA